MSNLDERVGRPSRLVRFLPVGVVADREAEEGEPYTSVDGVQRVTNPRLTRLELQPDTAQPLFGNLLRSLYSSTSVVEHHEGVGVDGHVWAVVVAEAHQGQSGGA